jgi:hypothetical protein
MGLSRQHHLDSLGASLSKFSSIILVIDIQVSFLFICTLSKHLASHFLIQDSYQQSTARTLDFFVAAYQIIRRIQIATLEAFVQRVARRGL